MKANQYSQEIEGLLSRGGELTVDDFFSADPGLPSPTVYSRIRSLVQRGVISRVGRGRFVAVRKPVYEIPVTDWMLEVNEYLIDKCPGVNNCISQRGKNLFVEVARKQSSIVIASLKQRYEKVISQRDYDLFPSSLEGFVIVGALISEAPVTEVDRCFVPSIEKELVDSLTRSWKADSSCKMDFQRALEIFPVNIDRLRRYASRRGVAEELDIRLSDVDSVRVELFSKVQKYFSTLDLVNKVWVFGSFARREETAESDIDLLVDYVPEAKVSLLDIVRQRLDLEKLTGRPVDLVENGYLKPFAAPSAEQDKYLIYER